MATTEMFACCMKPCDIQDGGPCTSPRQLDFMMHDRWHHAIQGADALAKTLRHEWNMSTSPPLRPGNRQIFIYVPACLRAIEAAFSIANLTEEAVTELFQEEKAQGLACPELPCRIRVDERLNNGGCGAQDGVLRIVQVRDWLKAIEQGRHPGQGPDSLLPVNYQPSGSAARYFDIPYVDQRCYYAGQSDHAQHAQLTSSAIVEATPRSSTFVTGNLVLGEQYAITNFLALSSGSEQHRASPDVLFKLAPGEPSAWSVSFFGTYALSPALLSRAREISERNLKDGYKPAHLVTATELSGSDAYGKKNKGKTGGLQAVLMAKNADEFASASKKYAMKNLSKWGKSAMKAMNG